MQIVKVGPAEIGATGAPLTLIAGPCVAESLELCREIAGAVKKITAELGIHYIFKASFDKANRSSATSYRGPGLKAGLEILAAIRSEFGVPVLTDVHETCQCDPIAEVCDVLQIPAFLSRQTDLLLKAGETGKAVNIKKGQFLAPSDMKNAVEKVVSTGNRNLLLTERGVSFGYQTLIVDMTSLPQMRSLGYPVVFDGTHSVQLPGAAGNASGGRREFIPHLTRAAAAVGIDGLFLEVHPHPEEGLSDSATMLSLKDLPRLLSQVLAIQNALSSLDD